ncbi:MAG: hypothetical protein ACLS95_05460 [Clostridia bacterium]
MEKVKVERVHKNYATFTKGNTIKQIFVDNLSARDVRELELAMMLVGFEQINSVEDGKRALNKLQKEPPLYVGLVAQAFGLFDCESENITVELEKYSQVREILEHVGMQEIFITEEIL